MAETTRKAPIYYKRMARGLTQQRYAKELHIHHVTLSRLETYQIIPGKTVAKKLAPVVEMTWQEVVGDYAKNHRGDE